jgi:hypothetical protein
MEPEGSLPSSQQPAMDPTLSRLNPVQDIPSYFSKIQLSSNLNLHLSLQSGLFPFGFSTKILYECLVSPVSSSSIWGRKYKLWSCSLCCLLKPSITSSLLGQNILLSTLFSRDSGQLSQYSD